MRQERDVKPVRILLMTTLALALATPAAAHLALEQASHLDCSRARDPWRCSQRLQALAACEGLSTMKRRHCLETRAVTADCARAPRPALCAALTAARAACKNAGKDGRAYRRCLQQRLPGWRGTQAG